METTYEYVGPGKGNFSISSARARSFGGGRCVLFGVLCGVLTAVVISLLAWWIVAAETATTTHHPNYNCSEGLVHWEWEKTWSDKKKEWCCTNEDKGCPRDCLTQSCDATCWHDVDHKGHGDVTCRDRVNWAKEFSKKLTSKSLSSAIDLVNGECHCQCACSAEDFGAAAPAVGICLVFGSLHHTTFDGAAVDYFDEGTYWLVKTSHIHVQARYKKTPDGGRAAVHEIAIGGRFLDGHILKVGPVNGGKITWGGQEIFQEFGHFDPDGLGKLVYDDEGQLIDATQASLPQKIVHINFPRNFFAQVYRWENHLNIRIRMPSAPGLDGHCGNFNGLQIDDEQISVANRIGVEVGHEHSMFDIYTARSTGPHVTMDDCDEGTKAKAEQACKTDEDSLAFKIANKGKDQVSEAIVQGCMLDYCFAASSERGELYAKTDEIEGW